MKKRTLASVLCAMLAVSMFASCGSDTSSSSASVADNTASTEASSESSSENTAEEDLREPELVTLDVVTMASGKTEEGTEEVENAMNAILGEKLNCNVNLTFIGFGNYAEQTTLLLSSGEGADMLAVYMISRNNCARTGQIIPLDDLLEKYGQGIIEQMGMENINCFRTDGEIYGLPQGRDWGSSQGFEFVKSVADEVGFDYENIKTLDDLETELKKVKEAYPDMWPVAVSAGENIRNWGWDSLGDDMTNLGVLADMATDTTVVNLYETDQYKNLVTTMYNWMQEGLIQADAVNTTETCTTLMTAGTAFGGFTNLKPGFAEENTASLGYEIGVVDNLVPGLATTSSIAGASWSISSGCKNPEAAMKVLNEMYSNSEIANLYMYGIEGEHYQVVEKGGASNGMDMITYPDGVDASTSTYRKSGAWLTPNQFIGDTWVPSSPDYWDVTREWNNSIQKSAAYGFSFEDSSVANEITACTNVVSKYNKALLCGALDPETTLEQFNKELYDAGLQKIIDAKQEQLDAWLANN